MNLPLADSENERARELVTLDEQFVTDIAAMPPEASAYFRRRPFLTSEVMQEVSRGLPAAERQVAASAARSSTATARLQASCSPGSAGTFALKSSTPHWKASDRSEREPIKTRFVKGFHRGLELYGEDVVRHGRAQRMRTSLVSSSSRGRMTRSG